MDSLLIFIAGLIAGLTIGAWAAWQMWLKREKPQVQATLVVDQELLNQIQMAQVVTWLNQHGLIWMPKGAAFNHDKAPEK